MNQNFFWPYDYLLKYNKTSFLPLNKCWLVFVIFMVGTFRLKNKRFGGKKWCTLLFLYKTIHKGCIKILYFT